VDAGDIQNKPRTPGAGKDACLHIERIQRPRAGCSVRINGDAAQTSRAVPGDLLSLDDSYGGLLVSDRYVFVSDLAVQEGLKKYEPDALLNGLITEHLAA
jgi:hypothetical protein